MEPYAEIVCLMQYYNKLRYTKYPKLLTQYKLYKSMIEHYNYSANDYAYEPVNLNLLKPTLNDLYELFNRNTPALYNYLLQKIDDVELENNKLFQLIGKERLLLSQLTSVDDEEDYIPHSLSAPVMI